MYIPKNTILCRVLQQAMIEWRRRRGNVRRELRLSRVNYSFLNTCLENTSKNLLLERQYWKHVGGPSSELGPNFSYRNVSMGSILLSKYSHSYMYIYIYILCVCVPGCLFLLFYFYLKHCSDTIEKN